MIKSYDSVEKWQFSLFHPASLCNKRIWFVCNGCEASLSFSKNVVQNYYQFNKNVFLARKLTKLEHFNVYILMFSMKISQILDINL